MDDTGSSTVRAKIFTGYPTATTGHPYMLNFLDIVVWPGGRGVWATCIGLKFGTSPKFHYVNDAVSSPVSVEIFTDCPAVKEHIGYISDKLSCGPAPSEQPHILE